MKRKVFMREFFGRIALTFLLLCLIVYTVYHALGNTSGSLLTTPARKITDTQLLGGEAWLFREETLLTVPWEGLVNSVAQSGAKVGKNSILTEVWVGTPADEIPARQAELDRLNRTIAVLENSLLPEGTTVLAADGYRFDAMNTLMRIREAMKSGEWDRIPALEDGMLALLNRYQSLTDSPEAVEQALNGVKAERAALLTGEKRIVDNPESSGYYYDLSCVDGYETLFGREALQELTVESFEALKTAAPVSPETGFVVGKICYGYTWNLAVEFPAGTGDFFEKDTTYAFRFPESDGITLTLICEKILQGENGASVAVFRSDVTPSGFRYLRSQKVEITVGSYRGYYIPEQAAVTLNGYTGVYIFEENTVRFRRVDVLFEGDGYLIASEKDGDPENGIPYLSLNDLLVTAGKKLYDGKVYK